MATSKLYIIHIDDEIDDLRSISESIFSHALPEFIHPNYHATVSIDWEDFGYGNVNARWREGDEVMELFHKKFVDENEFEEFDTTDVSRVLAIYDLHRASTEIDGATPFLDASRKVVNQRVANCDLIEMIWTHYPTSQFDKLDIDLIQKGDLGLISNKILKRLGLSKHD